MEFFAEVAQSGLDKNHLKQLLTLSRLPELCSSISSVLEDEGEYGVIYCVWGEFALNREELKYGVRFSMPGCPNALAWSVTCDDGSDTTLIHCTINKHEHDPDFIESIQVFVSDWSAGIRNIVTPPEPKSA
jgi:hypothetical protein